MTDHATRYLVTLGLDDSPANRRLAERRAFRAGRLAQLGAHLVPGVLSVQTIEHGDADYMAKGSMFASVVLDLPAHEFAGAARQLDRHLTDLAAQRKFVLIIAMKRATWGDRLAERVHWMLRLRA